MKQAVKAKFLFDPETKSAIEDVIVLVENDKVTAVKSQKEAIDLSDYKVIDLGDNFLSPGLIDCHVHLSGNGNGSDVLNNAYETIADLAFHCMKHAQIDLLSGFTTLRVVGTSHFADVALNKAIKRGDVVGPRLLCSGPCVGSTGGHADSHYNPYIKETVGTETIGDGVSQLVKATRYAIKHGAECIKFMSTGGVMSLGTNVNAQQMSFEEMKAVIDTAKMYGLTTATHCHGTSGIKDAARAGVTSIEHATLIDEEGIQLMLENGTFMVPTIIAGERICSMGKETGAPEWMIEKSHQVHIKHTEAFARGYKAGIKIAFGSDASTPGNFHGQQTRELLLMNRFGMPANEVFFCATKSAAELLRMQGQIGDLKPGFFADMVAYDGNPLEDLSVVTNPAFVMKGGKVVKQNAQPLI